MVKMNKKSFALFCYPWDIIDEGYDAIIDAVKRSGLNSIYVTVNYHSGMFFYLTVKKEKYIFLNLEPYILILVIGTKIILFNHL